MAVTFQMCQETHAKQQESLKAAEARPFCRSHRQFASSEESCSQGQLPAASAKHNNAATPADFGAASERDVGPAELHIAPRKSRNNSKLAASGSIFCMFCLLEAHPPLGTPVMQSCSVQNGNSDRVQQQRYKLAQQHCAQSNLSWNR